MTDFDAEIREHMAGLALCAGCEENWVKIPAPNGLAAAPVYCEFCELVAASLESDYHTKRKSKLLAMLPRVDAGTAPIDPEKRSIWAIASGEVGAFGVVGLVAVLLYLVACFGHQALGAQ